MTVDEQTVRHATIIRRLAELYGYTPTEIGDMPIRLIDILLCEEQNRESVINRLGNRTTMTISEWNRYVEGRKNV